MYLQVLFHREESNLLEVIYILELFYMNILQYFLIEIDTYAHIHTHSIILLFRYTLYVSF